MNGCVGYLRVWFAVYTNPNRFAGELEDKPGRGFCASLQRALMDSILLFLPLCWMNEKDILFTGIPGLCVFPVHSAETFDTGMYTVIDSSQRDTILKELEFSLSGCTDESCRLEIGRLLSAEMIVIGDIGQVGSRFVLTAKLLETETSKTLGTAKGIYPDLDGLLDDMNGVVLRLAKGEEGELPRRGSGYSPWGRRSSFSSCRPGRKSRT